MTFPDTLQHPLPRYSHTWDAEVVTVHILSMGANETLTLKCPSQKLVVIMVLVQSSRTSELKALDTRFRVYKPDGVCFRLAALTKKRTLLPSKELFLGAFPDDKRLCVAECLCYYEKVTLEFRTATRETALFLSYTRPHKPVTSQPRLVYWIKDLMG